MTIKKNNDSQELKMTKVFRLVEKVQKSNLNIPANKTYFCCSEGGQIYQLTNSLELNRTH